MIGRGLERLSKMSFGEGLVALAAALFVPIWLVVGGALCAALWYIGLESEIVVWMILGGCYFYQLCYMAASDRGRFAGEE